MGVFRKAKINSSRRLLNQTIDEMVEMGFRPRNRDKAVYKALLNLAPDDFKRGRRGRRD